MHKTKRTWYWIFLLFAQPVIARQSSTDAAVSNVINSYHEASGFQPALYNGSQFYGYLPTIKSFVFFGSDEWYKGSIVYDGVLYNNINLKFDLLANKVVVRHAYGSSFYLFSERVSSFTLGDNSFVRLQTNPSQASSAGFFHQAVTGKMQLLVQRSKAIREKIVDLEVERDFVATNKYYLLKEGKYISVANLKDVIDELDDKKKAVKQYLKKNKIRYRSKNPEPSIVAAVTQYNELSR